MNTQRIAMVCLILSLYVLIPDQHKLYAASSDRLPSVVNLSDKPEGVIFINRPAEATIINAQLAIDINHDGYDDIIIRGVVKNNESNTGDFPMIYVMYGGPNFPSNEMDFNDQRLSTASIRIESEGKNLMHYYLAPGDINGDGAPDFIFTSYRLEYSNLNIIMGRSNWQRQNIVKENDAGYIKMDAGGGYGWGMDPYTDFMVTDMNKDGIDDIAFISNKPVVDPNWYDIIPRTVKTVYILYGNENLPSKVDAENTILTVTKIQEQPDSLYQASNMDKMAFGDFDQDNKPDLIIRADHIDNFYREGAGMRVDSSLFYGKTYIVYGSLFTSPEYTQSLLYLVKTAPEIVTLRTSLKNFTGNAASRIMNELFSCDINGDGYDDPIIAYYSILENNNKKYSKVYILHGNRALFQSSNIDLMDTGITRLYSADSTFGYSFASGDVNGDGYTDLLINNVYKNSFYVLYGGVLPDSIDIKNDNVFTTRVNGASLGCVGDINGDGYDDIVCDGYAGNYVILGRGQTYQLENQIVKILPISKDSHFKFKFTDGTSFDFDFTGSSLSTTPLLHLTNFGSHLPDNLNSIPTGAKAVSFIQAKLTNMSDTCTMNCAFEYDKQAVRSLGIKEENLSVSYWDENLLKWQKHTSSVDTVFNRVNFETNHFSLWTLTDINDPVLSVDDRNSELPLTFRLEQNYPNPFNPITTIKYQLPKSSLVILRIYNILGQEVKTVISEQLPPGIHEIQWDGTDKFGNKVASGIYIYRMVTNSGYEKTRKLVYLK